MWIILINLAIVINPKFTANKYNDIWNTINGHVYKLQQDVFKQAGVSVEVYTTTNIKLSKGKVKYMIKLKNSSLAYNYQLNRSYT